MRTLTKPSLDGYQCGGNIFRCIWLPIQVSKSWITDLIRHSVINKIRRCQTEEAWSCFDPNQRLIGIIPSECFCFYIGCIV